MQKRKHINVMSVVRSLVVNSHLANHQRMHTERNLTNAMNVAKLLPNFHTLADIRRCMLREKPHKCNECGKHFTQRFKPYGTPENSYRRKTFKMCNKCDKAFIERSQLWGHERIHTGE